MSGVAYAVQTPVFEGPFDLLLHLILREQVDLYEISLSTIVDAYLVELTRMEHLDLEVATEFLLIAATLVELKTRVCCPETTTSTSTTSCRCGRSAICCSPACSSARRSRTPPGCSSRTAQRGGPVRSARCVGPDERFFDLAPDLLEGVTARRAARGVPPGHGAQGAADDRPVPRRTHPGERGRRRRRLLRRAAPPRARSRSAT